MSPFEIDQDIYETRTQSISWFSSYFPTLTYYARFFHVVVKAGRLAKRNQYNAQEWAASSWRVLRDLESVGVQVRISGIQNIAQMDSPCLIIANHMSTLETTVLPGVIRPHRKVTFVVKASLLKVPFFKHVMRSRNPIVVGRTDPRSDLKNMLEGGVARLNEGTSIVIFPQGERTTTFTPEKFNSIGIKLAKRANVPIIPVALKTDAWGVGKRIPDLGIVDPSKKVHITFGKPMTVEGRGNNTQQAIIEFIQEHLTRWNQEAVESNSD